MEIPTSRQHTSTRTTTDLRKPFTSPQSASGEVHTQLVSTNGHPIRHCSKTHQGGSTGTTSPSKPARATITTHRTSGLLHPQNHTQHLLAGSSRPGSTANAFDEDDLAGPALDNDVRGPAHPFADSSPCLCDGACRQVTTPRELAQGHPMAVPSTGTHGTLRLLALSRTVTFKWDLGAPDLPNSSRVAGFLDMPAWH